MPRGHPSIQRLASAARGMAQAAAPHADVFIGAGFSTDFIAQLNAAADALLHSVNARSQHRSRRTSATTGLKAGLAAGRRSIHILDTLVKSVLKGEPALLAGWNAVKRVPKASTHTTPPVTQVPTAVPTPAPASTAATSAAA
jgi:hypothetical protein